MRSFQETPFQRYRRLLIQFLIISCVALVMADAWSYLYAALTHSPPPNWRMTGRPLGMITQGQFYTPAIHQEAMNVNEWLIGLLGHYLIGCKFALAYMLLLHFGLKAQPRLLSGCLLGLLLAIFPYLFQLPSIGAGVLGQASATSWLVFFRVLTVHFFFGFGLGLGSIMANALYAPRRLFH